MHCAKPRMQFGKPRPGSARSSANLSKSSPIPIGAYAASRLSNTASMPTATNSSPRPFKTAPKNSGIPKFCYRPISRTKSSSAIFRFRKLAAIGKAPKRGPNSAVSRPSAPQPLASRMSTISPTKRRCSPLSMLVLFPPPLPRDLLQTNKFTTMGSILRARKIPPIF